MRRRLLILVAAVAGTAMVTAGVAGAVIGSGHTIKSVGKNSMKRNAFIKSTLRWSPGARTVASGSRVRFTDADTTGEPHIVLVVRKNELPNNVDEVFSCGFCNKIVGKMFSTNPPTKRLNRGKPGLDARGDALLLLPGSPIAARVSAKAGTTLHYLCAIHPWMQGTIKVT
jgi:hypothetical protein